MRGWQRAVSCVRGIKGRGAWAKKRAWEGQEGGLRAPAVARAALRQVLRETVSIGLAGAAVPEAGRQAHGGEAAAERGVPAAVAIATDPLRLQGLAEAKTRAVSCCRGGRCAGAWSVEVRMVIRQI